MNRENILHMMQENLLFLITRSAMTNICYYTVQIISQSTSNWIVFFTIYLIGALWLVLLCTGIYNLVMLEVSRVHLHPYNNNKIEINQNKNTLIRFNSKDHIV